MYIAERVITTTYYTDYERTITRTETKVFKTCDYTIDKCRNNLTEQIKKYTNNPYIVKVVPMYEHFETM